MRVIDEDGKQIGILSKRDALEMANEADLDLVLLTNKTKPAIARIIDWNKYLYLENKKKKSSTIDRRNELKKMSFKIKISQNDLAVKIRKITKFLQEGHKVKISVILMRREIEHKDLAFELTSKIEEELSEFGVVEQQPQFSGRQLNMIIRSTYNRKNAEAKKA